MGYKGGRDESESGPAIQAYGKLRNLYPGSSAALHFTARRKHGQRGRIEHFTAIYSSVQEWEHEPLYIYFFLNIS